MRTVWRVVACLLLASCTIRSDEKEILPWLKLRSTYEAFGGFGGTTQHQYLVKRFGFWFELDATAVSVLGPDMVLATRSGHAEMVHRGRWTPVLLCEKHRDLTRPPGTTAVDCLYATRWAGGMPGDWVEIRLVRLDPEGQTVSDRTIAIDGTGRIFPPGSFIRYYDELGKPWMLIQGAKAQDYRYMPRDCALVTYGEGAPAIVAGPAEMTDEECRSKSAWEKIAGRPLHDAHPRLPSNPVKAR